MTTAGPELAGQGLVAWFRPDVRRPITRAWIRAFLLVVAAMLVLAIPLGQPSAAVRAVCWAIGGGFLLAGPLSLMVQLQRILGPEIILSVHQSGVRWQNGELVREIPWVRIERVEAEADGRALRIVVEAPGAPLVIAHEFMDLTLPELALLLEDYWRKALMGLPLRGAR